MVEGTLVQHGACLFVQSASGHEWLVIWPRGYGIGGDSVVEGTYVRAKVGEPVRLGGGEYHEAQYDFLRSLMDQDVDATCRSDDYWLATGVE